MRSWPPNSPSTCTVLANALCWVWKAHVLEWDTLAQFQQLLHGDLGWVIWTPLVSVSLLEKKNLGIISVREIGVVSAIWEFSQSESFLLFSHTDSDLDLARVSSISGKIREWWGYHLGIINNGLKLQPKLPCRTEFCRVSLAQGKVSNQKLPF